VNYFIPGTYVEYMHQDKVIHCGLMTSLPILEKEHHLLFMFPHYFFSCCTYSDMSTTTGKGPLSDFIHNMDPNKTGLVDFVTLSNLLSSSELRQPSLSNIGQISNHLSDEDIYQMQEVHTRALSIASAASENSVKLLFDAEQTWVQPAIDNLVLGLQKTFNDTRQRDFPIIFHTYQCYLKGSLQRIEADIERSQQLGYHFGAKLVRGAYIHSERQRAKDLNIASPIHDTVEDTHACYDGAIKFLLGYQPPRHASKCSKVEVMIATHNQISVEKAIQLMNDKHILKESNKVHFAQLLGMSDNLSFPLGNHGYSVFKYVPYGKVEEAIPYLLRRAAENRDVLKGNKIELQLIYQEIARRLRKRFTRKLTPY
jgi:proline dehydrogenase